MQAHRRLTFFTIALILVDGAALAAAGLALRQRVLVLVGGAVAASSLLVIWYWRRHQRRLAEIERERAALAADLRSWSSTLPR